MRIQYKNCLFSLSQQGVLWWRCLQDFVARLWSDLGSRLSHAWYWFLSCCSCLSGSVEPLAWIISASAGCGGEEPNSILKSQLFIFVRTHWCVEKLITVLWQRGTNMVFREFGFLYCIGVSVDLYSIPFYPQALVSWCLLTNKSESGINKYDAFWI